MNRNTVNVAAWAAAYGIQPQLPPPTMPPRNNRGRDRFDTVQTRILLAAQDAAWSEIARALRRRGYIDVVSGVARQLLLQAYDRGGANEAVRVYEESLRSRPTTADREVVTQALDEARRETDVTAVTQGQVAALERRILRDEQEEANTPPDSFVVWDSMPQLPSPPAVMPEAWGRWRHAIDPISVDPGSPAKPLSDDRRQHIRDQPARLGIAAGDFYLAHMLNTSRIEELLARYRQSAPYYVTWVDLEVSTTPGVLHVSVSRLYARPMQDTKRQLLGRGMFPAEEAVRFIQEVASLSQARGGTENRRSISLDAEQA